MYKVKNLLAESALIEKIAYGFRTIDENKSNSLMKESVELKLKAEERFLNMVKDDVNLNNIDLFDLFGIERM